MDASKNADVQRMCKACGQPWAPWHMRAPAGGDPVDCASCGEPIYECQSWNPDGGGRGAKHTACPSTPLLALHAHLTSCATCAAATVHADRCDEGRRMIGVFLATLEQRTPVLPFRVIIDTDDCCDCCGTVARSDLAACYGVGKPIVCRGCLVKGLGAVFRLPPAAVEGANAGG